MKLSLLTQDNYQEKLATVEAMGGLHMCQWRAGQVLAWLEINLGMPMYGRNCALNIKSGKVRNQSLSQQQGWQSPESVVTSTARVARYRITCCLTINSGKVTSLIHLREGRPPCSGRSSQSQEWQGAESVVTSPSRMAKYRISRYLNSKGGKVHNHLLPHHQEWQGNQLDAPL